MSYPPLTTTIQQSFYVTFHPIHTKVHQCLSDINYSPFIWLYEFSIPFTLKHDKFIKLNSSFGSKFTLCVARE